MLQIDLSNKVAIVTGGGQGAGRGIALELAKAGADVVVGSRNVENLENAAEEIRAMGRRSLVVATDIRIPKQINNLVQQTVNNLGGIDIVVNNAGYVVECLPEEIDLDIWDDIIGVNLKGPFLLCQAAGKVMIEQKRGGKIINISSSAGLQGAPAQVLYGAAKAGLINLTTSLASAWAKHRIYVNCVAPGGINSPGAAVLRKLRQVTTPVEELIAEGRVGNPEDIAYMVVFFASELSDFITGQTIWVRGGVPRK